MFRRFRPNSNVSVATLTGLKIEIRFSDTASFASVNFRLISLWEGRFISIMVSIDTFCQALIAPPVSRFFPKTSVAFGDLPIRIGQQKAHSF